MIYILLLVGMQSVAVDHYESEASCMAAKKAIIKKVESTTFHYNYEISCLKARD